MITDLSGQVSVENGPRRAVSILDELQAGMRLGLEHGARMVVLYLQSGDEYSFAGPARVEIERAAPRVMSGAKALKRSSRIAGNVSIKPGGVRQAAYVMRSGAGGSIKLTGLVATRIIDAKPEFRWQPVNGAQTYRLELSDGSGRVLLQLDTDRTFHRLPETVNLQEGMNYTWEVSARAPDGRRYVGAGDFILASSEIQAKVKSLRPVPGAPFSDRVAYAVWLEQQELRDEARHYWRDIAAERPGDRRLRSLAEQ